MTRISLKMFSSLSLLWIFVIIWHPAVCSNLCHSLQNTALSDEECSDLYFEPSEKATVLGRVKLELVGNVVEITPSAPSWSRALLRVTTSENETNPFCSQLANGEQLNSFCLMVTPEMRNETFLLEYKIEDLPEINSRKFLFMLPNLEKTPLFLYIDETDKTRLILNAQKVQTLKNVTYYKVEAYKEKSGNTNLQDFIFFSQNDDIYYEFFTYNDMGNYYFVVTIMSDNCTENSCLKIATPKVFIGRKSTRLVIGIVGASFILPFVLFIFHILTKKYPEDGDSAPEEKIVVAYRSSTKKHNEVVFALAALLGKIAKEDRVAVEVVELSKASRRFCNDALAATSRVVYVAPPKNDVDAVAVDKSLSQKEVFGVIFDHCADDVPRFVDSKKIYRLLEDFDELIRALYISGSCNTVLYQDLRRKIDEVGRETGKSNAKNLPKIVVTEIEPQEQDSLISTKVLL